MQRNSEVLQRDVLRKQDSPGDLLPASGIQFPTARLASHFGVLPGVCGTGRPRPTGCQCPLPGTCTHLFAGLSPRSPLRQHFLHGGERGCAGADGHDGPVRPGHRGRVSGLRDRGEQRFWAPARYRQPEHFVVQHGSCSCPQHPHQLLLRPWPPCSVSRPSQRSACLRTHAHPLYKDSPLVSGQL